LDTFDKLSTLTGGYFHDSLSRSVISIIAALLSFTSIALAQGAPAAPATQPAADARPSPLNAPGFEYPKVDSKAQATFRINAPKAQSVVVGLGKRFALTKGNDGVWSASPRLLCRWVFTITTSTSTALLLMIRARRPFFGSSKWMSGIDIPDPDGDFYQAKDVPHGEVRIHPYFSKIQNATRRSFIYTPPGYDSSSQRYPVLYLQHGAGEDETGWSSQGRMNFILDNLIAEGKAKPMIVVMENGGGSALFARGFGGPATRPAATAPTATRAQVPGGAMGAIQQQVRTDPADRSHSHDRRELPHHSPIASTAPWRDSPWAADKRSPSASRTSTRSPRWASSQAPAA
jgi:hypothetical protein